MSLRPAKSKNGTKWLAAGIGIGIIFIGLFLAWPWIAGISSPANSFFLQNCRDVNRASYGIIPEVFADLPSPPKCMYNVVEAFQRGHLQDSSFFSRDYYLQPEFYPDFGQNGIGEWVSPAGTHWGIVGYGAFPVQQTIVMHPGETKKVRLFVHAGFGVRTYQGMRIRVDYRYPTTPDYLSITLNESANTGFLLGPTFPKFDPQWSVPVEISLSVAPDSPSQNLEMLFYSSSPQNNDALAAQVTGRYYDATSYLGERALSALIVQIRE